MGHGGSLTLCKRDSLAIARGCARPHPKIGQMGAKFFNDFAGWGRGGARGFAAGASFLSHARLPPWPCERGIALRALRALRASSA